MTEGLKLTAPILPEDREKSQNEVSLVKRDTFAVDAHEDVGNLLFAHEQPSATKGNNASKNHDLKRARLR